MSDPILNKPIKEYTIDDCAYYLDKYRYGENVHAVKMRLKQLRREAEANPLEEPKASPQEIAEVITAVAEHARGEGAQSHLIPQPTPVEEEYDEEEYDDEEYDDEEYDDEEEEEPQQPTEPPQPTYTPNQSNQGEGAKIFWGCLGWIFALACGFGVVVLIISLWEECPKFVMALAGLSVTRGVAELFELPGRNPNGF